MGPRLKEFGQIPKPTVGVSISSLMSKLFIIFLSVNSSKLTCEWINNAPSGKVIYEPCEGEKFTGTWVNNMAHGHGEYKYSDNGSYVG